MRYVLLSMMVLIGLAAFPSYATAQEKTVSKPLFITPYQPTVPSYNSNVPSVVKSTGQNRSNRTYTQPNRVSRPMYDTNVNQFPADFGRITGEQDFYDSQTKRYYGQYDYFKLLAQRGDTAKLQEVVGKVQRTGVFDLAKYQAMMTGNTNGTNNGANGGASVQRPVIVQQKAPVAPRQNQVVAPQRIHQGYDDDLETEQQAAPQARPKNAPIFLR